MFDAELVKLLACPQCRGELRLAVGAGEEEGLACDSCRLLYAIRHGIPVLLVSEAGKFQEAWRPAGPVAQGL